MKKNPPWQTTSDHTVHCRLFLTLLAGGSTAFTLHAATIENIVAPGTPFSITALNSAGQTAGFYSLSELSQRAFVWGNGAAGDLGTLGGNFSIANALNSSGTLVGFSAGVSDSEFHAFRSAGAVLFDLGTLGGSFSSAVAISDSGYIAGDSNLRTDDSIFHAFVIRPGGSMLDLGTLGGTSSSAYGVNNSGWVVGSSSVPDNSSLHAFLHNGTAMLDLGTLGGASSVAVDVNDAGQVTGDATTAAEQNRAFLYTSGVLVDLGTLGGTHSTAVALNERGVVIGNSTTADDAETHAFLYQNGVMLDLGSLGGGSSSAKAINNHGQVVGNSANANAQPRAFVWENGVMTDLNSLLPADSGWELTSARFINDRQQIVGEGLHQGQSSWYLLTLGAGQEENHPPVAKAGDDQTLMCNRLVHLDGTASSDPDGDALSFQWRQGEVALGDTAVIDLELAPGSHTLTLIVTDARGLAAEDRVVVNVTADTLAPVVVCPEGRTTPANSRGRAAVPDFLADLVATDNCTAASALVKRQSPSAGATVKAGTHVVTITVKDASGNVATCSTTFAVADVTSPVVRYPEEVFRRARTNCQAAVPDLTRRVKATDNVTPSDQLLLTQEPAPDTRVDVGTHTVRVTVTDLAGNATVCEIKLIVADVVAPVVKSVSASSSVLTPVDGRMVPVTLTVDAKDNCDPDPKARIISVVSSQPTTGPNDTTTPDWVVTGDLSLELRAENSATRTARAYFVLVAISDESGNTAYRAVWIRVPRS